MTSLSTYDFSTLNTTLRHNLIKDKLIDLIERTFNKEGSSYLACNNKNTFFTSVLSIYTHLLFQKNLKNIMHGLVKIYALTFLLDNIFIRLGTKLYRQVVGIPDFMMSLSDDKKADIIDAFNIIFRYLDDILNINDVYFDTMVSHIYPLEP